MNRTVITFIVLSLFGLIVIQTGMLRIGLLKEMESYDIEARTIVQNVSTDLFHSTELSQQIVTLAKEKNIDERTIFNSDSLPFITRNAIDTLIKYQLSVRGITIDYAFALTDQDNNLILTSDKFNLEQFKFNRYARPLGTG